MRIKQSRYTSRISSLVVASLMSAIFCVNASSRPKLVVGVMIEGLSMDQIDLLRDKFGPDGFNRLLRDGVVIENLDYGANLDAAAATALLYTGTTPSVNGVDGATAYDAAKRRDVSIYTDPSVKGVLTDLTLSPSALKVSTIADEVRIHSDGVGMVYSIALSPEIAIAMTGHAGNNAVWIDDVNGHWASSSYYKDLPTSVQYRNHYQPISTRIDTIAWGPSIAIAEYPDVASHRKTYPFRITFPKNDAGRFKAFKASAPANNEVTTLAREYIKSLNLGARDELDMLNLSFTVVPYPYAKDSNTRIQHIDSYLRLDRDLAQLFKSIEHGPGMDNTLFFVAGTPASNVRRRDDEKWNIPYGEFSIKKAQTLLNAFLMAKYGNGDWVSAFRDGKVFLNRQLIQQRGVDAAEMRSESAAFVARMAGVTSTATIDDIIAGRGGDGLVQRPYVALPDAADIYLALAPGWETVDNGSNPSQRMVAQQSAPLAPAFILYPSLQPERINTPVDARALAPAVSGQLRIRSPNGAAFPPLPLTNKTQQ